MSRERPPTTLGDIVGLIVAVICVGYMAIYVVGMPFLAADLFFQGRYIGAVAALLWWFLGLFFIFGKRI